MNVARTLLILVATGLLRTSVLRGDPPIAFTRVADSNTPIPGSDGDFAAFFDVSPSGNDVNFLGYAASDGGGTEPAGIYRHTSGVVDAIADISTAIPEGTGNFTSFGSPFGISGSDTAFLGYGSSQRGVYCAANGVIRRVADLNTQAPGQDENFFTFAGTAVSNGVVAFHGRSTAGHEGVYVAAGGEPQIVADMNTPVPGGNGAFSNFTYAPDISGSNIAFNASNSAAQLGVYASMDENLQVVADLNTPIPGGTGNFTSLAFAQPSIDGDSIAFFGQGSDLMGIYSTVGGLHAVVDSNTMVPGTDETFGSFLFLASVSGDDVAFMGWPAFDADKVIYAAIEGELIRILGEGDVLDGLVVDNLLIGREALDVDQLGFSVVFTDGTRAAYVATIPEPATLLGLLLAVGIHACRPRRRPNSCHA